MHLDIYCSKHFLYLTNMLYANAPCMVCIRSRQNTDSQWIIKVNNGFPSQELEQNIYPLTYQGLGMPQGMYVICAPAKMLQQRQLFFESGMKFRNQ